MHIIKVNLHVYSILSPPHSFAYYVVYWTEGPLLLLLTEHVDRSRDKIFKQM